MAADPSDANRDRWILASRALWREQRGNGFPWLVTDFLTLGSPLAHGLLLLARNSEEFGRRKRERELPTSPPQMEPSYGLSFSVGYEIEQKQKRSISVLNHGAVFALTLWTNLCFPARMWFKGDVIGGPVVPAFGNGVIDLSVRTSRHGGWLAHTGYWAVGKGDRLDSIRLRQSGCSSTPLTSGDGPWLSVQPRNRRSVHAFEGKRVHVHLIAHIPGLIIEDMHPLAGGSLLAITASYIATCTAAMSTEEIGRCSSGVPVLAAGRLTVAVATSVGAEVAAGVFKPVNQGLIVWRIHRIGCNDPQLFR